MTPTSFPRHRSLLRAARAALTCALLGSLLIGCGDNQEPEEAVVLWNRIQSEDYRSFERAPGFEMRQPSNTAHSDAVDIYVNSVLTDALASGETLSEWPVGSLIVKDGFNNDGELDLVAVMDKRDTGWFWAEYTEFETGDALFSGSPGICTGCHESGADFVRAFGFP